LPSEDIVGENKRGTGMDSANGVPISLGIALALSVAAFQA